MPYRASRSMRSGRPGQQADHDMFAGLPVRQWRVQDSLIGSTDDEPPAAGTSALEHDPLGDVTPELPMPKGADMYQVWSHKLLRAARAGRLYARSQGESGANGASGSGPGKGESDKENAGRRETGTEEKNADEEPRGTKRGATQGFVARRWSVIPKQLEEPERDRLAKRRKGLPPLHAAAPAVVSAAAGPTRKTKVKRTDPDGQVIVWEVIVPEGQAVEGEIEEEVTLDSAGAAIAAPEPGTVVEGLGVANEEGVVIASEAMTPSKKKGAVSHKKKKALVKIKGQKSTYETTGKGVSASAREHAATKAKEKTDQEEGSTDLEGDKMMGENDQGDNEHDNVNENEDDDGDDEGGEGYEDREDGELSPTPDPEEDVSAILSKSDGTAATPMEVDSAPSPTKVDTGPASPVRTSFQVQTLQPEVRPFRIPGLTMTAPQPKTSAQPAVQPMTSVIEGTKEAPQSSTVFEDDEDEEEYEPPDWQPPPSHAVEPTPVAESAIAPTLPAEADAVQQEAILQPEGMQVDEPEPAPVVAPLAAVEAAAKSPSLPPPFTTAEVVESSKTVENPKSSNTVEVAAPTIPDEHPDQPQNELSDLPMLESYMSNVTPNDEEFPQDDPLADPTPPAEHASPTASTNVYFTEASPPAVAELDSATEMATQESTTPEAPTTESSAQAGALAEEEEREAKKVRVADEEREAEVEREPEEERNTEIASVARSIESPPELSPKAVSPEQQEAAEAPVPSEATRPGGPSANGESRRPAEPEARAEPKTHDQAEPRRNPDRGAESGAVPARTPPLVKRTTRKSPQRPETEELTPEPDMDVEKLPGVVAPTSQPADNGA